MKKIYLIWGLCLLLVMSGGGALAQTPAVEGLVTVQSASSVEDTVAQLQSTIQDRGLTVMTTVDHAANAEGVGLELRPTQLIIFGNPNLGTQFMQSRQTVGVDLPQKFLVWEDETGQVNVSYNDPQYLQSRHDLQEVDQGLATAAKALGALAESATAAAESETTDDEPVAAADTEGEPTPATEPEAESETAAADDEPAAESDPEALPTAGADRSLTPWLLFGGGVLLAGLGLVLWFWRRRWAKLLLFMAVPLLAWSVFQPIAVAQSEANGLVTVDSPHSTAETVTRLLDEIEARGLTVMTTVDHAANAEGVGLELRPTQLIIFGNPNLGTQLMQSSQTVAIDLPQKFLVWEDAEGQVHVTYNDPQYLGRRHAISDRDEALTTASNALSGVAEAATAP